MLAIVGIDVVKHVSAKHITEALKLAGTTKQNSYYNLYRGRHPVNAGQGPGYIKLQFSQARGSPLSDSQGNFAVVDVSPRIQEVQECKRLPLSRVMLFKVKTESSTHFEGACFSHLSARVFSSTILGHRVCSFECLVRPRHPRCITGASGRASRRALWVYLGKRETGGGGQDESEDESQRAQTWRASLPCHVCQKVRSLVSVRLWNHSLSERDKCITSYKSILRLSTLTFCLNTSVVLTHVVEVRLKPLVPDGSFIFAG